MNANVKFFTGVYKYSLGYRRTSLICATVAAPFSCWSLLYHSRRSATQPPRCRTGRWCCEESFSPHHCCTLFPPAFHLSFQFVVLPSSFTGSYVGSLSEVNGCVVTVIAPPFKTSEVRRHLLQRWLLVLFLECPCFTAGFIVVLGQCCSVPDLFWNR